MAKFGMKLILERLPEHALPSCTCACRVSALQTKVLDQTMKLYPIVVFFLAELDKVLAGLRH